MFTAVSFSLVASALPNVEPLKPYAGPTTRGVDTSTLDGKVMCGYQGWFNVPEDGSQRGFAHWARRAGEPLEDGNVNVELWPDVSELSPAEVHATGLHLPDGRIANVFSSTNAATVMRHFQWMLEYGIDGAFVQRFATQLRSPRDAHNVNTVLDRCRAAANANGRAYAVMYDLSGLRANETQLVMDDWHALRHVANLTDDPAYLHHHGKPLVTIWGIGFNDDRAYTLDDCAKLIAFFKQDGCTVMIGTPTYWRDQNRDTIDDPKLHDVIAQADIISPWTVGRFDTSDAATRYATDVLRGDLAWCVGHKIDYLPVVFPGFSWHNLRDGNAKSDQIPRLGGRFLWTQFVNVHVAGARSAYVAMFDELDEGTAIFKLARDVPMGAKSKVLPVDGVPGDFYLRLVGEGGRLIRGERNDVFPAPR